jgi:hypothetical protein
MRVLKDRRPNLAVWSAFGMMMRLIKDYIEASEVWTERA